MTYVSKTYSGVPALCIGVAFAAHLIRVWWLELTIGPVAERSVYALEDVLTIIDSPLWLVSGVMHLVVAAALSAMALSEPDRAAADHPARHPAATAALIGSGSFLLLGMTNLIGVPQIGTLTELCAEDGRTALVAYNIIRTVFLGSSFLVLGWFLLSDTGSELRRGNGPKFIHVIGLIAGVLCVLFVFSYTAAPLLITTLMMATVMVWGLGLAMATLVNSGSGKRAQ
jgi:hypothetical protein